MGHHSKKNSKNISATPVTDINSIGQLLNNVDINAMSNMLSGIDINQIMSMLSNAFVPPSPSPSQVNVKPAEEVNNNITPSPEASKDAINLSDILKNFVQGTPPNQTVLSPVLPPSDPIVIVLNSLKPLLPPDKAAVIDDMIKLLGIKAVIDSIFPPAQVKTAQNTNSSKDITLTDANEVLN